MFTFKVTPHDGGPSTAMPNGGFLVTSDYRREARALADAKQRVWSYVGLSPNEYTIERD